MSMRTAVILCFIGALLLPLSAQADNPYKLKSGADGELCLTCHEAFKEKMKLRHIHSPVEDEECSQCHNPHASNHGDLLVKDPDKICLMCHDDLVPDGAHSVHKVVAEGKCIDCHDPHASRYRNLLRENGEKLCFQCHADIEKAVKEASVIHDPAKEGCLDCHDPHASKNAPFLLTENQPDLCLNCHDPDDSRFKRGHLNYPVSKATCSVCHDPHGSERSGLLKNNVHSPVAKRMCGQCHKGDISSGKMPSAGGGLETCGQCHKKIVEGALHSADPHWPVLDRQGCLICHDPHASKQPDLLSKPMGNICGGCHPSVIERQLKSKAKHEPVMEGNCVACHSPHSSQYRYLFPEKEEREVCAGCHDYKTHSTHPLGEDVQDPRNTNVSVDCSSCHRPHGTPYDHLFPYATYTFLCTQCHTGMRR